MGRIHLFEFEDLDWFPKFLRDYGTDFLQFLSNKTGMFLPIVPMLVELLENCSDQTIIDLASGGGGGLLSINSELQKHIPNVKIILSDYYPNISAFEYNKGMSSNIDYISSPIDARNVPEELRGIRTQFLSFHHFTPEDAALLLQNALDCNTPIAIFEAQERSIASILAMVLSPLTLFFTTPFIKPFSFRRLLFTYLIPIVPLFVVWDGVVSSLRTYSVEEMNALVNSLENSSKFEWKIGKLSNGPTKIVYLIGSTIQRSKE